MNAVPECICTRNRGAGCGDGRPLAPLWQRGRPDYSRQDILHLNKNLTVAVLSSTILVRRPAEVTS